MPTQAMILVTGAAGNIGGAVVRALRERGHRVRAVVRDTDLAELPDGVGAVAGDLRDAETYADGFDGVLGVFVLAGYDDEGLVQQARRAGVHRLVLLSAGAVDGGDPDNAVVAFNAASEQAVRESGIDWTILRPSGFMSNALRWVPQFHRGDEVVAPFGGVPVACIDPADIATVAAVALTDAGHARATYRLTGPTPMVPAEQVAILARLLERPLTFRGQSDGEAYADMRNTMPLTYADAFRSFFVDGTYNDAHVRRTVEEITGAPPHAFEAWARAHLDAFRAI